MSQERPQNNFTNIQDFYEFILTSKGYLEKANGSNLGDLTDAGKIVNAGYANYTIFWKWYQEITGANYQKEAYCAGWVSVMYVCGFGLEKAKKLLGGKLFIYCPTGWNQFNAQNRIFNEPKAFDVVFFWSDSLNRWSHTGIVINVDSDGKGYTTIEANTSSGNDVVVRNGGAVCVKHYTLGSRKVQFGRPDYEGNGISMDRKVDSPSNYIEYRVHSGNYGLTITTNGLNVRETPGTDGEKIRTLSKGNRICVDGKCFINGDPWYHVTKFAEIDTTINGWISGKYMYGWICEEDDANQWWYVLEGYKYYTDTIANIEGSMYAFGSNGYMLTGKIVLETDASGAIKSGLVYE